MEQNYVSVTLFIDYFCKYWQGTATDPGKGTNRLGKVDMHFSITWLWKRTVLQTSQWRGNCLPLQPPLKLIHTATPDTTKLSCLCRVRFGRVNWIRDNSRLSPTENLKSEHVNSNFVQFTQPRQTRHRKVCLRAFCVWPAAQCDRRTHSDAERTCPAASSHRHTRQDKTVAPASRPPPWRKPGRQLRLAARPPTRSDVVRHAKYKQAADCCVWLGVNFFAKRRSIG